MCCCLRVPSVIKCRHAHVACLRILALLIFSIALRNANSITCLCVCSFAAAVLTFAAATSALLAERFLLPCQVDAAASRGYGFLFDRTSRLDCR
jgi:hypothetical protein